MELIFLYFWIVDPARATLYLITAPWGAGKTTLVNQLTGLSNGVVFDWDLLIPGLSAASGKDVTTASSTWAGLTLLWADIIQAVLASGQNVILCGPATPETFKTHLSAATQIRCAYLDCPDELLTERLRARGETETDIVEELAFAAELRASDYFPIEVADLTPRGIAERVSSWVNT